MPRCVLPSQRLSVICTEAAPAAARIPACLLARDTLPVTTVFTAPSRRMPLRVLERATLPVTVTSTPDPSILIPSPPAPFTRLLATLTLEARKSWIPLPGGETTTLDEHVMSAMD